MKNCWENLNVIPIFLFSFRSRNRLSDTAPVLWTGHVQCREGLGGRHQHPQQHGQGGSNTSSHGSRKRRLSGEASKQLRNQEVTLCWSFLAAVVIVRVRKSNNYWANDSFSPFPNPVLSNSRQIYLKLLLLIIKNIIISVESIFMSHFIFVSSSSSEILADF